MSVLYSRIAGTVDVFGAGLLYRQMQAEPVDLSGKTVIVTGSNAGIGLAAATTFAEYGSRIVLACRNESKAEAAKKTILEKTPNARVDVMVLDVSSLASVKTFAERWAKQSSQDQKIDVLCSNAGAKKTIDGREWCYTLNHLGGFALTLRLCPFLADDARIIFTSSFGLFSSPELTPENLDSTKMLAKYDEGQQLPSQVGLSLYSISKAMQALAARELARRFEASGSRIKAYSYHPGLVKSEIWGREEYKAGKMQAFFQSLVNRLGVSTDQGAATMIWLATNSSLGDELNGQFFMRKIPYTLPAYIRDEKKAAAIFKRFEDDAGLTLDAAMKQRS